MNKIVKNLLLGSLIYGVAEYSYTLGKGQMLSILRMHEYSAERAINELSNDGRLKLSFIAWLGKQDFYTKIGS